MKPAGTALVFAAGCGVIGIALLVLGALGYPPTPYLPGDNPFVQGIGTVAAALTIAKEGFDALRHNREYLDTGRWQ